MARSTQVSPELFWRFVCFHRLFAVVSDYDELLKQTSQGVPTVPRSITRSSFDLLRDQTTQLGKMLVHLPPLMSAGDMRNRIHNLADDISGLLFHLEVFPSEYVIGGFRRSRATRTRIEFHLSHLRVALEEPYFAEIPAFMELTRAFDSSSRTA